MLKHVNVFTRIINKQLASDVKRNEYVSTDKTCTNITSKYRI